MTRKNKSPPPHFFHCAINSYSLLFIFLLVKLLLYLKVFPVLWSNSGYQALEGISWEILFVMLCSIRVCICTVWETGRIPSQRDGPLPAGAEAGPVHRVVGLYSLPPSFCSTRSARIPKAHSQTNPRLSVYEFPEFISVLPSKGSVMFQKKC